MRTQLFNRALICVTILTALGGCAVNSKPPPHCAPDALRVRVNPEPPQTEKSAQPAAQPASLTNREGS